MSEKKPLIPNGNPWMDALKDPTNQAFADFMRDIPFDAVKRIVKTSTGGLAAVPKDYDEAISLILNFSDAVSTLNRQALLKDYLIKYLIKKNVKFNLKATKSELCNLIIKLWGTAPKVELVFNEEKKPKPKVTETKFSTTITATTDNKAQLPSTSTGLSASSSSSSSSSNITKETKPIGVQTVPEPPKEVKDFGANVHCQVIQPYYPNANNDAEMQEEDEEDEDDEYEKAKLEQTALEKETGQLLGFQFAEWFYTRLNKLEDFTPEHFWKDCNLMMHIESQASPRQINVHRDGDTVCLVLRSLVAEEGCFFNPNTLNGIGIRGIINPHGLAQVMVCGTVHRGIAVLGTFEQNFGLMKDPTKENNFKIKFCILRLRERSALMNGESTEQQDTTMSGIIEEIDD